MPRFRTKISPQKMYNLAGGAAYKVSPKFELLSILLTSFAEDKFYRSFEELKTRINALMIDTGDLFAAKAAVYARRAGMRSITHYIAALIAKKVKGQKWTKNFFKSVFLRPDDMLETLACYMNFKKDTGEKEPIPNSLKKGIASRIVEFDEYQIAKYRGEGRSIKMVDAVNICHPKPTDAINKLMKGELKSTDTWEARLSEAGKSENVEKAKNETWSSLIKEKRLGYFACLRNLNNIALQAPDVIDGAIDILLNKVLIQKSMVLPFRYLTAYKNLTFDSSSNARKVMDAIDTAAELSLMNLPEFEGKTLIMLDVSGSMGGKPIDVGSIFAAALAKKSNADIVVYNDEAKYVNYTSKIPILELSRKLVAKCFGGTDLNSAFRLITDKREKYDRIIILSDMQSWLSGDRSPQYDLAEYEKAVGVHPKVYSFDLNGYGSVEFNSNRVFLIAGWSEKVFDIMKFLEQDPLAAIKAVEAIEFGV